MVSYEQQSQASIGRIAVLQLVAMVSVVGSTRGRRRDQQRDVVASAIQAWKIEAKGLPR